VTASRAHIYCRVSSAGQEDGYSLDTQERASRSWCAEHGLTVASVAREVWSGGDRHRPELDAALSRIERGDTFVAYALDRLSRDQIDTAILIDHIEGAGASLQLVTEDFEKSATGTFLRGAKAFAAELELEKIRERTQRGRRERVA
jgi:DNA invertase Pin-like site-specific DNA recombinase